MGYVVMDTMQQGGQVDGKMEEKQEDTSIIDACSKAMMECLQEAGDEFNGLNQDLADDQELFRTLSCLISLSDSKGEHREDVNNGREGQLRQKAAPRENSDDADDQISALTSLGTTANVTMEREVTLGSVPEEEDDDDERSNFLTGFLENELVRVPSNIVFKPRTQKTQSQVDLDSPGTNFEMVYQEETKRTFPFFPKTKRGGAKDRDIEVLAVRNIERKPRWRLGRLSLRKKRAD